MKAPFHQRGTMPCGGPKVRAAVLQSGKAELVKKLTSRGSSTGCFPGYRNRISPATGYGVGGLRGTPATQLQYRGPQVPGGY